MTTGFNLSYDTNALVGIVPSLLTSQSWLLDKFFPSLQLSDTEFVSIDIQHGARRMSPFVSPLVEGKLVEQLGMRTNVFRPAYIKDKRAPDLLKPVRRMIGERLGGELTGQQRAMANLVMEMEDQVSCLTRRLEWMAAQALQTGSVTISGEGFDTVSVDFGRNSDLTIANSSGEKWTVANIAAGTADPTLDIEKWQRLMLKTSGAVATDIVFTTASWAGFLYDQKVKQTVWYAGGGGTSNTVNVGPQIQRGAVYKGKWGNYDLWVYNDWYLDENNVDQPMLTDGNVVLCGPDLMGTRAFGAIIDPEFNYGAMAFAPKTWVQQDPAQRLIMMQSAPIVIPSRVNASLCATVADAVEE